LILLAFAFIVCTSYVSLPQCSEVLNKINDEIMMK